MIVKATNKDLCTLDK